MLTEREKRLLENHIYRLVKESLFEMGDPMGGMFERKNKLSPEHYQEKQANRGEYNARKSYVMKFLDDNKTLHSTLAYKLWPNKDKDSARSLFSKKYSGESEGKHYAFSPKEINRLYNMVTSFVNGMKKTSLSESRRRMNEDYDEDMEIREQLWGMDPESACEYIMSLADTGNEIELDCGLHFGMGLYAYRDTAEQYLPGRNLRPTQNPMFVVIDEALLREYLQNVYETEGHIG